MNVYNDIYSQMLYVESVTTRILVYYFINHDLTHFDVRKIIHKYRVYRIIFIILILLFKYLIDICNYFEIYTFLALN